MTISWSSDKTILKMVSKNQRKWLTESTIITKSLKKVVSDLSVQVISEGEGCVFHDEAVFLQSEQLEKAYIRQIYLCGTKKYTFGRVVIPNSTYEANKNAFDTLGNKPIGETLLYNNHNCTRGEFQYCVLTPKDPLFKLIALPYSNEVETLGARRSIFSLNNNPILISEVFLPDIPDFVEP